MGYENVKIIDFYPVTETRVGILLTFSYTFGSNLLASIMFDAEPVRVFSAKKSS